MCYKYFYKSDLPLLFMGESGTGKTFSAKIAHDCSCRKNKPFVAVTDDDEEEEKTPSVSFTFNYLLFHITDAHKK